MSERYETPNDSLNREISREVRLDDIDDLQHCLSLAHSIYETLRLKEDFVVGDTQHSLGITHKPSRNTTDMRFVLKDTMIDEFSIINPRKDLPDNGITIIAQDKNIPNRKITFSEMITMKDNELLQNAFFVDDSHAQYFNSPHLAVDAVALESDIIPWLLFQEGYSKESIIRIINTESDPVRYAVDILSKRADSSVQLEELRADIHPDVIVGGQRIEERDPKQPLDRVSLRLYTLWITTHFETEEFGNVNERTIIRFSPEDPFMLHPDSVTTSVRVELEFERPLSQHKMLEIAQQQALDKADGKSVSLLQNLEFIQESALKSIQAPL